MKESEFIKKLKTLNTCTSKTHGSAPPDADWDIEVKDVSPLNCSDCGGVHGFKMKARVTRRNRKRPAEQSFAA